MRSMLVLMWLAVATAVIAAPPRLELDSAYIDMGSVPVDSVREAVMRFRNAGGEDLEIFRIFSDCGCTVPSCPAAPVPPGGEGEIRIRFDAKGRSSGGFRKTLRIRSNADNPRQTLTVKGVIK